jgi:hypothetical protein
MNFSVANLFSENPILISFLQKNVTFSIKGKVIKKGKLLLFRKTHYFIQFSLETSKKYRENIELPFPFGLEYYPQDQLLYFDYRIKSLTTDEFPVITDKANSTFLNNIVEIQVEFPKTTSTCN